MKAATKMNFILGYAETPEKMYAALKKKKLLTEEGRRQKEEIIRIIYEQISEYEARQAAMPDDKIGGSRLTDAVESGIFRYFNEEGRRLSITQADAADYDNNRSWWRFRQWFH